MSDSPAEKPVTLPIVFILITLVIDAMGIGLILPVMPDLLREVSGGNLAEAARWGGLLATIFALMQFLFGPFVGSLSDRFGRRPVLLVSLAFLTVDYLITATAQHLWILFAAHAMTGVFSATQSTATAFIADISKPEQKAARFGLVGAAFGIGFVLGPAIGGLLGELDTRAPFFAAAGLAFINFLFGYFVLPETVTDKIRRNVTWQRANPIGALSQIGRLPGVSRLILLFFLYEFAFLVYPATWSYFTRARFGWDDGMVGLSLAAFGLAIGVVQGGLIRIILKRLGERGTVLYGIVFNGIAFVIIANLTSGTMALLFTPLTALGAVVTPALQSMMSRTAGADEQGVLQGVLTSARSVAAILSPILMTRVFAAYTEPDAPIFFPGAPFLISFSLMVVCGAVVIAALRSGSLPADSARES